MFWLGKYTYASKEELKGKLKSFLAESPDGLILHPILVEKLHELLLLHPRAEEKIGVGIQNFAVARNQRGSGKSFKIIRIDGTEERFSYKMCIEGQMVTNRAKVIEALRFAIKPQLLEFRQKVYLPITCGISGRIITTHKELHIDHKIPFWSLVQNFCLQKNIDLNILETEGNGENIRLVNKKIELEFQDFHRKHAELQVSLKEANLEKGGSLK